MSFKTKTSFLPDETQWILIQTLFSKAVHFLQMTGAAGTLGTLAMVADQNIYDRRHVVSCVFTATNQIRPIHLEQVYWTPSYAVPTTWTLSVLSLVEINWPWPPHASRLGHVGTLNSISQLLLHHPNPVASALAPLIDRKERPELILFI